MLLFEDNMHKLIQTNPYRFLGVFSNSPIKERVANVNRLKAFLRVGKAIAFPSDMTQLIPPLERTAEGMEAASARLNLPHDQIKHALFWFINASPFDKIALEHLQVGNIDKAIEILLKKETFSSLMNLSVIDLAKDEPGPAIDKVTKVIHDDDYREGFVKAVAGDEFEISEEDLAVMYIDALQEEIAVAELRELFRDFGNSPEDDEILDTRAVDEPKDQIYSAIADAKDAANTAAAQYAAGIKLMQSTKAPLALLRELLDEDDLSYQTIADKLATQILQCGINYHNKTNEDDATKIEKAYRLQNYAKSIAAGSLVKDRCTENVAILERKKKELPPKGCEFYNKKVREMLVSYGKRADTGAVTIELVKACAPYLASIKEEVGASSQYYLKISTAVVAIGLSKIIDEFNAMMNDSLQIELILNREATLNKLRKMFNSVWQATLYMEKLDMEYAFKTNRFNGQKEALRKQVTDLINVYQSVNLPMRSDNQMFGGCKNINDYNKYLEVFAQGKHADEAKKVLEKLEFEALSSTNGCKLFKEKYPQTTYPILDRWQELYYKEVTANRTIEGYKDYLEHYPNGKYAASAKEEIEKLEMGACQSLSQWKQFLQKYPNSKFNSQAQAHIEEEKMWEAIANSEEKAKFKEYLAKYPNGRHRKEAEKKASACYIATMVYGDYNHPQVVALRGFRDDVLRESILGQAFIRFYYKHSPAWVEKMQDKPIVNGVIRKMLNIFIKFYNHESK